MNAATVDIATDTGKTPADEAPSIVNNVLNRSKAMQLMHEDLARAHSAQRHEEALRRARARRLVVAHRAARRAEESAMRARRLLALAIVR
jgi:hypothetical protein